MVTISLCMIVKNEEAVLARCLDSVRDLVDEIIIVDTGSTDRTKEIAARYTGQIYDFPWESDFSAARNFSFSKARMDYIYAADADEMLDETNRTRFLRLKQCLLPEIEIVQMKYVTKTDFNTVLNSKKEYRPKLYKRLRSFTWVDPIHETVRLDPVVFDSDVEILHMPPAPHQNRDFSIFRQAYQKDGILSNKIFDMYAKELFISGSDTDFTDAAPIFRAYLASPATNEPANATLAKKAALVLLHTARITDDFPSILKFSLDDMLTTPSAEACMEIGEWFFEKKQFDTAILWFYHAAFEAESILNARSSGNLPLARLSDSYRALAELSRGQKTDAEISAYLNAASDYLAQSEAWELPEE